MSILSQTAARLPSAPVPGLSWAVRNWLRRSFGEPPLDPDGTPGDHGLFGPGSASWQVFGDAASIVGGIRSLLVELTHPLAMAGVSDHSRYLDEPLERLQQTSAYFALITFGSTAEAVGVTRRVRAMHRRVTGHAPDGRPYDAARPDLLTWVSITATASFLVSDRAFGTNPLPQADRDRFVAEQSRVASLLDPRVDLEELSGIPDLGAALHRGDVTLPLIEEGWMPLTEQALDERLASFDDALAVGQQGRTCLKFLLWPPVDPLLRLGYLPTLAGALATLEPGTLRLLGLPIGEVPATMMRLNAEVALVALRTALASRSPSAEQAGRRAEA
ncbi:oxygenase MpaB family protein [Euzebya tangerina]|uniref:oxygenase MpaB family protein n=1 Tax=Euzebya tangerina TaxID=591198 RepID=UPI000E31D30E|nr:oxygenase MpaB family protein [Euzebya tangerina]